DLEAALVNATGSRHQTWSALLTGGADGEPPSLDDYRRAVDLLLAEAEVALIVLPDVWDNLAADAPTLLARAAMGAAELLDRMVIAGLSRDTPLVDAARLRDALSDAAYAAIAVYYPWLEVEDLTTGVRPPVRAVPPEGHIAGLVSRLDRER